MSESCARKAAGVYLSDCHVPAVDREDLRGDAVEEAMDRVVGRDGTADGALDGAGEGMGDGALEEEIKSCVGGIDELAECSEAPPEDNG